MLLPVNQRAFDPGNTRLSGGTADPRACDCADGRRAELAAQAYREAEQDLGPPEPLSVNSASLPELPSLR